jgi:redox-sensitive bicupin YhaK (pirin superfamily)
MITLRRSEERYHDPRHGRDTWHTFSRAQENNAGAEHFGSLELLDESRLAPGASVPLRKSQRMELVTYVREGAIAYDDGEGRSGVVRADEFQTMMLCRGGQHQETNASELDEAHVVQIGLHPWETGLALELEQKRFTAAVRRGSLCLVASPDGRRDTLRIHQDALIYSALLERGKHVVHELMKGRSAWIHVVHGQATFGDRVLATGDGAGLEDERSGSLTARQETEIIVIDLRDMRDTREQPLNTGPRS